MSSPKYTSAQVLEIAKRTLDLPAHVNDSEVPAGYLAELGKHVSIHPHDVLFQVNGQTGYGYGRVVCLEHGCNRAVIPLTKRVGVHDGGMSEGIGGLSAYRNHLSDPAHKASRLARLKVIQASRTNSNVSSLSRTPNNSTVGRVRLLKVLEGQAVAPTPPATPERPIARPVARQSLPNLPERTPPSKRLLPLSAPTVPLKRPSESSPRGREDVSIEESISAARRPVQIPAASTHTPPNHPVYTPANTEVQLNVSYSQNSRPSSMSPKRAKVDDHTNDNPPDYQTATQGTNLKIDVSINVVAPSTPNSSTPPSKLHPSLGHPSHVEQLRAINENMSLFHRIRMGFVRKKRLTATDRARLRGTDSQIANLQARKNQLEALIAQEQTAIARATTAQNMVITSTQVTIHQQGIPPEPSSSISFAQDSPPAPLQARMAHDPMYGVMDRLSGTGDISMQSLGGLMVKEELDLLNDLNPYDGDGNWHGRGKDRFIGPMAQPGEIQQFFQDAGNAEFFDASASVNTALEKLKLPSLNVLFPGLSIALMPHQVIGVAWMLDKERSAAFKGGILSDEMGLGKTVQMIATMTANKSEDPAVKTTLIVAPLALLDQWKLEIEMKTDDSMKCLIYHGQVKAKTKKELMKYDVVLTTFQTLAMQYPDPEAEERRDIEKKKKKKKDEFIESDSDDVKTKAKKKKKAEPGLLLNMNWYRIVLDEAQFIKNKKTRVSRAVTFLTSELKWCLTGTPITNGLGDIYPLLRFLRIRPWYDWLEYNQRVMKLERKAPNVATSRLQAILATCLLRRKKDTELDGKRLIELPPKDVHLRKLDFSPEEREIYNMVETRSQQIFNRYLRAGTVLKNYAHVLVMLLRLRQICSHTSLITEEKDVIVDDNLEDADKNDEDELIQAHRIAGPDFVNKLKTKLREVAVERIAAEKESPDAALENEECPICFDLLDKPVVTSCMHFFCRKCINVTLNSLHVIDPEQPNKYNQDQRPCPVCREPVSKDSIFARKAFESTDKELQERPEVGPDDKSKNQLPKTCNVKPENDDDDEEMPDIKDLLSKEASKARPAAKKTKGKAKATRKSTRKTRNTRRIMDSDDEEEEGDDDYDSDLSDFIVQSDEDEEEKDARRELRKKTKKRIIRRQEESESELDDDIEVIIDPKQKKAMLYKGPIKVLPKQLPSTKMIHMMENLQQWATENPGEKTIVVSQWTQCLDLVSAYLITKEFKHVKYQGSMNRKKREIAVRAFMKDDSVQVMLMSLKCGGVGLNLTRGNRVISMDLGWSEAVENQAFDRVHRLGQMRPVVVHRLIISNTVEDRVLALQEKKRNLADGSLGEGNGKKIGRLTVRQLANLFGLDHHGNLL